MMDSSIENETVAFEMDIGITEDVAAELETFIVTSRLGLHYQAQRIIDDVLRYRVVHFPVFAEIASYYIGKDDISALKTLLMSAKGVELEWHDLVDKQFLTTVRSYTHGALKAQVTAILMPPSRKPFRPDDDLTKILLDTNYDCPTTVHIVEVCLLSLNPQDIDSWILTYVYDHACSLISHGLLWESTQIFSILSRMLSLLDNSSNIFTSLNNIISILFFKHMCIFDRDRLMAKLHGSPTILETDVPSAFYIMSDYVALLRSGSVPNVESSSFLLIGVQFLFERLLKFFGHSRLDHPDTSFEVREKCRSKSVALGKISVAIIDELSRGDIDALPFWIPIQYENELENILDAYRSDKREQRRQALIYLARTEFFSDWTRICTAANSFCEPVSRLGTDDSTLLGLSSLSGKVPVTHLMDDTDLDPRNSLDVLAFGSFIFITSGGLSLLLPILGSLLLYFYDAWRGFYVGVLYVFSCFVGLSLWMKKYVRIKKEHRPGQLALASLRPDFDFDPSSMGSKSSIGSSSKSNALQDGPIIYKLPAPLHRKGDE